MARFYNPGFKWDYTLKFDNPTTDDKSSNISYYKVVAEARSFFEVKDTQTIALPTGEEYEIPLRFKELIRQQYAEFGVVLVAPGRECSEEENIAPDEETARKKGHAIWKKFTTDKCNEWFQIVEEVRANGRLPRPAEGLFKRCLEERGIADPADIATGLSAAKEGQKENKDLQAQLAALTAQVNQLLGAKNAKGA
jgi:hypothetical protein